MTIRELLLAKVMEECAEITQRAAKAQRFGLTEVQPGQDLDNETRLLHEFHDLVATMMLLFPDVLLNLDKQRLHDHLQQIEKFMDYSRSLGILTEG